MPYDSLYGFRQRAHQYLGRAHGATFELVDAVLTTRRVYSFAELSQSPLFRRQWSSVHEALQDSRPQRQRLMRLYLEHHCSGPSAAAGLRIFYPTFGVLCIEHAALSSPDAYSAINLCVCCPEPAFLSPHRGL